MFQRKSFKRFQLVQTPTALVTKVMLIVLAASFAWPAFANLDQPKSPRDWSSYRDLSTVEYNKKLSNYKAKGYRPIDVEITGGTQRRYAVVFRKNKENLKWAIHTQLNSSQFSTKWNSYKSSGYRLIDQESYRIRGKQYYGGIWIKNSEKLGWASFRNLTSAEFTQKFNTHKSKYMPIDVEAYSTGGSSIKYSVIYVRNTKNYKWALSRNILKKDFSAHFKKWSDKGYRLYDTNAYSKSGKTNFATIWVKDSRKWKAYRDMNTVTFHNKFAAMRDAGYRVADIATYKSSGVNRYAAIWIANSSRLTWSHKDKVTSLVNTYLTANQTMGFSVAIAQNGQFKYLKGFGKADSAKGKEAHGRTVYRLASVSKAVTGTLGFILQKKGKIDLSNSVRTYLPRLPTSHNYDVAKLVTNRSKIRHYLPTNDPVYSLGQTTAWNAVKAFMGDNLLSAGYNYSTHAYTVFAAAVEANTNTTFCFKFASNKGNSYRRNEAIQQTLHLVLNRINIHRFSPSLKN